MRRLLLLLCLLMPTLAQAQLSTQAQRTLEAMFCRSGLLCQVNATTSVTTPALYGGSAAGATLKLQGTSGSPSGTDYLLLNPNGINTGVGGTLTPAYTLTVQTIASSSSLGIVGTSANGTNLYMQNTGAGGTTWRWIASQTGDTLNGGYGLFSGSYRIMFDQSANIGLSGATTFGTSASGVIAVGAATAPTTSPAAMTQFWSANVAGGNTAGLNIRDEPGNTYMIGNGCITNTGLNGQIMTRCHVTELTTIASGITTQQTTITIPADAIVQAVPVRVTVQPGNTATMTVTATISGTAFQKGASISSVAGTTDPGTKNTPVNYSAVAAQTILLTFNATTNNAAGRVRVSIYYYTITPPTSLVLPEWLRDIPTNEREEHAWFARWQPAA